MNIVLFLYPPLIYQGITLQNFREKSFPPGSQKGKVKIQQEGFNKKQWVLINLTAIFHKETTELKII